MSEDPLTELYLITPPRLDDTAAFADQLSAALDTGGAAAPTASQDVDDDTIRRAADILRPVSQDRCRLVMNDRPDLARETGYRCSRRPDELLWKARAAGPKPLLA